MYTFSPFYVYIFIFDVKWGVYPLQTSCETANTEHWIYANCEKRLVCHMTNRMSYVIHSPESTTRLNRCQWWEIYTYRVSHTFRYSRMRNPSLPSPGSFLSNIKCRNHLLCEKNIQTHKTRPAKNVEIGNLDVCEKEKERESTECACQGNINK